ncbi:MAG: MSMEG_0570 family nitrogen starvation response protein [Solirubrobacteraceae bacterium]|nr:MSMEG_0570 family nitrogen starvation response protein [Solirubrobacteraceae bacterium]
MPVVEFTIRWPDGVRQRCSSPSTVVLEHLSLGMRLPVSEFVARCTVAMEAASERVRERYGFSCGSAAEQQEAIVRAARRYDGDEREVHVVVLDGERAPGEALP